MVNSATSIATIRNPVIKEPSVCKIKYPMPPIKAITNRTTIPISIGLKNVFSIGEKTILV